MPQLLHTLFMELVHVQLTPLLWLTAGRGIKRLLLLLPGSVLLPQVSPDSWFQGRRMLQFSPIPDGSQEEAADTPLSLCTLSRFCFLPLHPKHSSLCVFLCMFKFVSKKLLSSAPVKQVRIFRPIVPFWTFRVNDVPPLCICFLPITW